jgi:predicted dehydrogenase
VRTLTFPSPWLKQHPTIYRRSAVEGRTNVVHSASSYEESFSRELAHFHACVRGGETCRTPPEQARLDIDVLTRMFLASR